MRAYDAIALAAAAVAARPDRPATALVHDAPEARLVVFRIEPGQQVAPHTSPSAVILVALSGQGLVLGADGEHPLRAGEVVAYEPNEVHGMRATNEPFQLLAIIAPRPSATSTPRS